MDKTSPDYKKLTNEMHSQELLDGALKLRIESPPIY